MTKKHANALAVAIRADKKAGEHVGAMAKEVVTIRNGRTCPDQTPQDAVCFSALAGPHFKGTEIFSKIEDHGECAVTLPMGCTTKVVRECVRLHY